MKNISALVVIDNNQTVRRTSSDRMETVEEKLLIQKPLNQVADFQNATTMDDDISGSRRSLLTRCIWA